MYPLKTKIKYDPDNLASMWTTYTTVYLGNYVSGDFDEGAGSHPGVDIFPSVANDTVYAPLDGVVFSAGTKPMDGNFVILRHDDVPDPGNLAKTTTLFSICLHLSEVSVQVGMAVNEGDVIGKTGNTGNVSGSTGEHLHFQIDRAESPFHPYWPFTMGEANAAGLGFVEAVNRGLGIENARKYTVNPLVYLDAVASSSRPAPSPVRPAPVIRNKPVESVAAKIETVKTAASVSNPSPTSPFSDVPATHPYAAAIAFIKARGIATGSNGVFRPDAPVTRAEILKMSFIASGKTLSSDASSKFSDVAASSWALPYVNTARELGAVSGYPDGTFRPDAPVTRAEALKIALGILSVTPDGVSFGAFSDVNNSAWFAPYAAWAKAEGVYSGSVFKSDAKASRAEVAGILAAALQA